MVGSLDKAGGLLGRVSGHLGWATLRVLVAGGFVVTAGLLVPKADGCIVSIELAGSDTSTMNEYPRTVRFGAPGRDSAVGVRGTPVSSLCMPWAWLSPALSARGPWLPIVDGRFFRSRLSWPPRPGCSTWSRCLPAGCAAHRYPGYDAGWVGRVVHCGTKHGDRQVRGDRLAPWVCAVCRGGGAVAGGWLGAPRRLPRAAEPPRRRAGAHRTDRR